MRKIHKVEIENKSDKIKQPSIPSSYGNLYIKPGKVTYEIPYDDAWGLTGDEKAEKIVAEDKDLVEIKKKFTGTVMAGGSAILTEEITEDGEWNPKPDKEGFELERLYEDSAMTKKVTLPIKNIQGDITLYARFIRKSFTCEVKDGERTLASDLVNWGESWNPNVSKEGHTLEGLYKEKEFTNKVSTPIQNVKEALTLYAKFTPNSPVETKSISKYTREELESFDEEKLKEIAEELQVDGYKRYTRKDSLINAILAK